MGVTLIDHEENERFNEILDSVSDGARGFFGGTNARYYSAGVGVQASASRQGFTAKVSAQVFVQFVPFDVYFEGSLQVTLDLSKESTSRPSFSRTGSVGWSAAPVQTGAQCNAMAGMQIANLSLDVNTNSTPGAQITVDLGKGPHLVDASTGFVCKGDLSTRELVRETLRTLDLFYREANQELRLP